MSESIDEVQSKNVFLQVLTSESNSDRAPVVFVHGGHHGSWQWQQSQNFFGERQRSSIALDWLNHGRSQSLDDQEYVQRGIADVTYEIGVAVANSVSPPVLVAHSMGGLAAAIFAAENPGAICALVLVTPVVPKKFAGEPIEFEVDLGRPWGPPPFEIAQELFFSSIPEQKKRIELYSKLQPESPKAVYEATRWVHDVDVEKIDVPIMVLAGHDDTLTPVDAAGRFANATGATFVELENCGHGMTFDPRWIRLCEDIEVWLRSKVGV